MSAAASTNPAISSLFQTLSDINSTLLSSPANVDALESASPADIVQISTAALALQDAQDLFGTSSTTPANPLSALESLAPPSGAASLQTAEVQALFNPTSTAPPVVNLLA